MKASARKSLGQYKPLIVHDGGRTEIVGKRGHTEHWVALTNCGETYHPKRGVVFDSRDSAIAYAQKHIDRLHEAKTRRDAARHEREARYAEQRAERGPQ